MLQDLYDAIGAGDYPEWKLCIQTMEVKDEDKFDFDPLVRLDTCCAAAWHACCTSDWHHHLLGVKGTFCGLAPASWPVLRISPALHLSNLCRNQTVASICRFL